MLVGVLALQGDFNEHASSIMQIDKKYILIKKEQDLKGIDAVILPGGESTSMNIIQKNQNLFINLKKVIENNVPTLGTCAGAILLSKKIENEPFSTLDVLNINVIRNAYGRQNDSFEASVSIDHLPKERQCFIRAPKITAIGKNVKVISKYKDDIVGVKQNNIVALTFHPEINQTPLYLGWLNDFLENSV